MSLGASTSSRIAENDRNLLPFFQFKKELLNQKVSKHLTFCFNPALDFWIIFLSRSSNTARFSIQSRKPAFRSYGLSSFMSNPFLKRSSPRNLECRATAHKKTRNLTKRKVAGFPAAVYCWLFDQCSGSATKTRPEQMIVFRGRTEYGHRCFCP